MKPYINLGIEGFMTEVCLQWLFKMAGIMSPILEVGSHYGRSTHALLSGCRGQVIAVDPWQDTTREGKPRQQVFRQFIQNVGHFPNFGIMRMPSTKAARFFQDKSLDMVFIDGNHAYDHVKADIEAWLPKARKLICGHDFSKNWPGVVQAVEELFPDRYELVGDRCSIWMVNLDAKS
jgi:predicted O-methyltransferase YrrM